MSGLTPDQMQKVFILTQTMIRFRKDVEVMTEKLEDLQAEVYTMAMGLIEDRKKGSARGI